MVATPEGAPKAPPPDRKGMIGRLARIVEKIRRKKKGEKKESINEHSFETKDDSSENRNPLPSILANKTFVQQLEILASDDAVKSGAVKAEIQPVFIEAKKLYEALKRNQIKSEDIQDAISKLEQSKIVFRQDPVNSQLYEMLLDPVINGLKSVEMRNNLRTIEEETLPDTETNQGQNAGDEHRFASDELDEMPLRSPVLHNVRRALDDIEEGRADSTKELVEDLARQVNHVLQDLPKELGIDLDGKDHQEKKKTLSIYREVAERLLYRLGEKLRELDPELQQAVVQARQTFHWREDPGLSDEENFKSFRNAIDGAYTRPGIINEILNLDGIPDYLKKPENHRARDYVFHKIIDKVLTQRNRPAQELFELYERVDMSSFLRFIRSLGEGLQKHVAPGELRGRLLGEILIEHYEVMQDAIFQSHDIDYWAGHAAGEMRQFQGAAAMYKNEYAELAANDPIVNAAMRAYEMALMMIRDNHGGYIPSAAIGYDPSNLTYYWDHLAEDIFKQFIANRSIRRTKRDNLGLPETKDGVFILDQTDEGILKTGELGDLEVKRVLKLAKGFGIMSMRLLEIFANSRGPGSDHPEFADPKGFHSIPYEGIARHMQPMAHLFTKWKFGNELYHPFFQQIVDPKKKWKFWQTRDVEKVYQAMVENRLDEIFGEGTQRLIDQDNLTNFSGGFGPASKWRIKDTILSWSDRDKEWLGGGIQLSFSSLWAEEKVKKYVEEDLGIDLSKIENPKGWTRRKDQSSLLHALGIEGEYQKYIENSSNTAIAQKLTRAQKAYIWSQMVERNPLLIARQLVSRKVKIDGIFYDITLRHKIIQDLLNVNLLEDKYRKMMTPSDEARKDMRKIAVLEADIAAVRERILNLEDHPRSVQLRDIVDVDSSTPAGRTSVIQDNFYDPDDETGVRILVSKEDRQANVKKYWEIVHKAITGKDINWTNPTEYTSEIRDKVGLHMSADDTLVPDWGKVKRVDRTIQAYENLNKLVAKDYNWLAATDDTSWRHLDLLNLGARHWIRRAGDLAAHAAGIELQTQYINFLLTPKPDIGKLIEHFAKMREAFAGDDIAVSWRTGYLFASATARLFEADPIAETGPGKMKTLFRPVSEMERIYGRVHADHWTANERRRWVDMLLENRIIPPVELDAFGRRYEFNAQRLRKDLRATDNYVIWEIITMGVVAASVLMALTALQQSLTEKDEKAR